MQSPVFMWLRGYVRIRIVAARKKSGAEPGKAAIEAFLNRSLMVSLEIWDIRVTADGSAECLVSLHDFYRLRPHLRGTGCRLRIIERGGFPFVLGMFSHRKWFVAGIALFGVSLYLLSSLVWQVNVVGNEKVPQSVIQEAAAKQGLYQFQWKFKLDEPSELSRRLQAALPDMAWVGVEVSGTHLTIRVVESKKPDPRPLLSPRNLIASKNAVITEIITEKGRPIVKQNTYVRKGDVLISGVIGDETHSKIVVAEGRVRGIVWYKSSIESPLTRHYNVQTGDAKTRGYLVIGSRALQLTGYGEVPYEKYETQVERSTLQWREWSLPFGWIKEKLLDVKTVEQRIDPAEARQIGLARAREQLLKQAGPDARILSEKILHEKSESGKVYMEVHFEVEESIAQEQPIVMQGE